MSQFFKSPVEEPKVKKTIIQEESSSKEEIQQSKKENKTIQIQSELLSVLESPTNKNVEKAFKLIIKNQKLLKKINSDFLKLFLKEIKNKKITKTLQNKAEEIYKTFYAEISFSVEKVVRKRDLQDILMEIINLEDLNDKLNRLNILDCTDQSEIFKILLTKLQIQLQNNLFEELLIIIDELILIYENNEVLFFNNQNLKSIFIGQINLYFDWLIKNNKEELILELKNKLEKYSPVLIEKKVLEFYYFNKKEYLKNNYFEFQIVYFIKNNQLNEAIQFYKSNQSEFDLENEINIKSLFMLAEITFKKNIYEVSFCIYEKLYNFDKKIVDLEKLLILCVVCENLEKNEFFNSFLESFVDYENEMLLKSCDRRNEIYRAFFMKHNQALEDATKVLKDLGYDVVFDRSGKCVLAME